MTKRYLWIVFLVFLAACGTVPPASPTPTNTPTFTPTATSLPTETLAPTVTPTSTPETSVKINCLEIQSTLPQETNLNGILALAPDNDRPMYEGFFLNLKTGEKTLLRGSDTQGLSSASVSPNSKLLAYYLLTDKTDMARLVIIGINGIPILDRLVSWRDWSNMVGWVDNEQLMFNQYEWDAYGNYLVHPLDAILYNPFTKTQKELPSDFPEIWTLESPLWNEFSLIEASYDPTLSYVVYPQKGPKLVLWDLQQKQQIAAFDTNVFFGSAPRWSPNGQKFLTHNSIKSDTFGATDNSRQELYSIDKNGKEQQLTRLTTFYESVQITKYSWSPDGRLVAFWIKTEPDNHSSTSSNANHPFRLAILDLQTQLVTNYCLSGGVKVLNPKGGIIGYSPITPIWSPDSSDLLIHSPNGEKNGMTVLVDIEQGSAVQIADNMLPIGWLISEP
jgi:hypothetical protein